MKNKLVLFGLVVVLFGFYGAHVSASDDPIQRIIDRGGSRHNFAPKILGARVGTNQFTLPSTVYPNFIFPTSEDVITFGQSYTISWDPPTTPTGPVEISIWASKENVGGFIAKDIPNTGTYSWNTANALTPFPDEDISSKLIAGVDYYILVEDPKDLNYFTYSDDFATVRQGISMPSVDLKVNGSDEPATVSYGTQVTISWNSSNTTYCQGLGDKVQLTDGTNRNELSLPTSGSKTAYAKVPSAYYPELFVDIRCYNTDGDVGDDEVTLEVDTTNADFPRVKVIAPNGGENIKMGDTYTLTWESANITGNVNIELLNDSGTNQYVTYIAKDVPNTGSYVWNTNSPLISFSNPSSTTPLTAGMYRLYVPSVSGGVYDLSDKSFYVVDGSIVNLPPVGYVDLVDSAGIVKGWALDPNNKFSPLKIELYVDSTSGTASTTGYASLYRADIKQAYGNLGQSGYSIKIPANFLDGKKHSVNVYAVDFMDATKKTLLSGSPKSFTVLAPPPPPAYLRDGQLFSHNGTIYVIENLTKRGFVSYSAFTGLGYNPANVAKADLSSVAVGPVIASSQQRHPRGALVSSDGTVYFMGAGMRYPFPSAEVFLSWGVKFSYVVPANPFDLQVPVGPVAQALGAASSANDAKVLSDVRVLMTALELFYNDNSGYPAATSGKVAPTAQATTGGVAWSTYLNEWPAPPVVGGSCGPYNQYYYTATGPASGGVYQNYTLSFCLGSASGGFAAGNHVATPMGLQ